jgi:GntR family transcriptional regulator/MocR family aminotransferase
VIEDDYDGEFRYGQRPIDALQAIDTEGRVIYIGTFSKALSPQMRLGYLVLPASLVGAFRQAKRLTDRHAPVLEQRVLASLIDSGTYERHVRRIRRENERRRAALLEAISRWMPGATRVEGSAAGLHVVVWLPWLPAHEEPAVVEAARRRGVGVHAVSGLFAAAAKRCPSGSAGFVVGYASLGVSEIERGICGWSEALADLQNRETSSRRSVPDPIK